MSHAFISSSLGNRDELLESIRRGLMAGAAIACLLVPPAGGVWRHGHASPATISPDQLAQARPGAMRLADFAGESASQEARQVADWIADSRDNGAMEFVIVDKREAKVFVFGADARLRGASRVLLGAAPGDDSVAGIGSRPIAEVRPEERTTPAGRFIGQPGRNAIGEDVVWVDYDAAVSMHRVRTTNPAERRLERLASPTIADKRISYGCINVPVTFFETVLQPTFAQRRALVYVLPETKSVERVFGTYDVARRHALDTAAAE